MEKKQIEFEINKVFHDCPIWLVDRFLRDLEMPSEALLSQAVMVLNKPYGFNAILLNEDMYGLSFVYFKPRQQTSLHYHHYRKEFFCVRKGILNLISGEIDHLLDVFGCGHSQPKLPHSLINGSDNELEVLEIFSPALINDKVRIQDSYNRALGKVEYQQ